MKASRSIHGCAQKWHSRTLALTEAVSKHKQDSLSKEQEEAAF